MSKKKPSPGLIAQNKKARHYYELLEFFEAGLVGLKPEFRFDIRFFEYSGENTLVHDGQKYVIYRTYRRGEYTELYTHKKAGVS